MAYMKRLIFLAVVFLLIGAGCTDATSTTPTATTTPSTQTTIKKKPNTGETLDAAYAFCEKHDYTIAVQFDQASKSTKSYCLFPNKTACDVIAFMNGACAQGKGALAFAQTKNTADELLQNIRTCKDDSPPVCGANGKNYANVCIADIHHVSILHEGLCTPDEQAKFALSVPTVPGAPTTPGSPSPTPDAPTLPISTNKLDVATQQNAAWLALLIDFSEAAGKKNPPAFTEKCTYDTDTVYYHSDGCPTCFSVLYSNQGNVLCYPNNDMNKNCPAYFNVKNRKNNCTVIWKDS